MLVTLLGLVLYSLTLFHPQSCTNISLERDGAVLFANNEDTHFANLVIGFYPPSEKGFGSVHIGYRHNNGSIQFEGVMNDQGLVWDVNSTPRFSLNPHPERPFSHEKDNYLSIISKQAATVEDAIWIAQLFDFGDSMEIQIHIADSAGDAVVISAGKDGELAFTRKGVGKDYLLLTNFNPANYKNSQVGWRYETAFSMLEAFEKSSQAPVEFLGEVLDAVHLNNLVSYTLYSNIFDLKNKEIYLFYMSQFDEVVVLNLDKELAKGERIQDMRDFFPTETEEAGDAAYHQFENRFMATKVAAIIIVLGFIVSCAVFMTKMIKKRKG
jgi:hypothetical protein